MDGTSSQLAKDLQMIKGIHICSVCAFEYEEPTISKPDFHDLVADWCCPCCCICIDMFHYYSSDTNPSKISDYKMALGQPFTARAA